MKLCFVVSEDWYFCSHRLPLAEEALSRGWDVCLIARMGKHARELNAKGIRTFDVEIDRGGINPINELRYVLNLVRIFRSEKPDVVHLVAIKPCLYGSIAARFTRMACTVYAITGMGSVFTSPSPRIKRVRPLVKAALGRLLRLGNCRVIMQNPDDIKEFTDGVGLDLSRIKLIRGSGVDIDKFSPRQDCDGRAEPLVILAARLLVEKGVPELIEAARILKMRGVPCRIALVGATDKDNPHAVSEQVLSEAGNAGFVEVWGKRSDVAEIYRDADIAVLPSYYREGVPKTLIEAAASGLPIVTTNSVGCREVVDEGINGLLVPIKQPEALACALEKLLLDTNLRKEMGKRSREKAVAEFDVQQVVKETFAIYDELLSVAVVKRSKTAK